MRLLELEASYKHEEEWEAEFDKVFVVDHQSVKIRW